MITLSCSSCQKPLSIDESKLPMKEVAFPCPFCKTKLTIDRRTLADVKGAPPPPPAEAPAPASLPADDEEFGERALIVGLDSPAVRQAAKSIGLSPVHFPTAQAARDFYVQEYPGVVFLNPAQLTPPPLADMQPITSVSPPDRRRGFFILLADSLRTLDGNAAFLYGVNLVVANKDLGSLRAIYRDADNYHKKLYQALLTVERH